MTPLYSISIIVAMLPALLYVSHLIAMPFSNILLAFGIACCSGLFTKSKQMFLPSYSVVLIVLASFIYAQWDTSTVVGSSLVCTATFACTLLVFANKIHKNLYSLVNHHLVSSYYFALSSMILCIALSMIIDDLTHEHIIVNSIYTVFVACSIVSIMSVVFFSLLPRRLKALTFIAGLFLGMWLCNRLGVIVAPVGTLLVSITSHIPSNFLVENFKLPALLPEVVDANLTYFTHLFNSQPIFTYPTLIMPAFELKPCLIMGVAGIFLALDYSVHAYASASLRSNSRTVYFSTSAILSQIVTALVSTVLTGIPLTLGPEGNALYRVIQFKEQASILVAGLMAIICAFLGKALWFIYAIRFPILGVESVLVASYFIFIGIIFFPNRSHLRNVFSTMPMLLTVFLYPTYFMFTGLPFPPLWILLALTMLVNFIYRNKK